MPDDNKIISGLWVCKKGAPLSDMERLCIHSFLDHGHEFHLWIYDEPVFDKPSGLVLRDANEILPREKLYYQFGVAVSFSDWFRWELMRKSDSWYVDMDMICLRPFDFREEVVWGKESDILHNPNSIKFPRTHPLVEPMTKACANPNKEMPWDPPPLRKEKKRRRRRFWGNQFLIQTWGESGGPLGFTNALKYFRMDEQALPSNTFCPVPFPLTMCLGTDALHNSGMLTPILKHSYALHLWQNLWREHGMKKNSTYTENSPYEILKRRHLPECAKKP